MNNVALVTCRVLPEPDPDQELLLHALRDAGVDAEMLAWDDRSRDPSEFGLCVLRSCWDYHLHPGSFLKWIDTASGATRLMNPAGIVRWNHHKRYLSELQAAGVPVIPTVFFERGEEAVLATIMETRRWDDVVIKPSVSASSFRTKRFTKDEVKEGHEFLRELLRDRDAMVQKYIPAVEGEGEKAIVWIDGEVTHAVRKSPRFAGAGENVSEAVEVSPGERALAELALSKARAAVKATASLLYARIDVVPGAGERPVVSELELIEPSLFLVQHPPALERLVRAIGNLAEGKTPDIESPAPEPVEQAPAAPTHPTPEPAGRKFIDGKPGGRKPGGRKPLGWTPEGRKSGGQKSGGRKRDDRNQGEWKPRGDKPGYRKPGEWNSRGGRPDDRKRGEWKPGGDKPDYRKPGGWKSGGAKSGDRRKDEWKPAAERPGYRTGGWKPSDPKSGDQQPGVWKPAGPASGYRKPGDWKPVGPKSSSRKQGGWKPTGQKPGDKKPGGWKSAERKPGGSKPGGRKSGPRKSGGKPSP